MVSGQRACVCVKVGVPMAEPALIVTCEHARNTVPAKWRFLFASRTAVLRTHHGYDRGGLSLARTLAHVVGGPLVAAPATRLLVDVNRSEGNPALFSRFTKSLSPVSRGELLRTLYAPVRRRTRELVDGRIERRRTVIHVSVHTFTPVLRGVTRTADIGILYDPSRHFERTLAFQWRATLWRLDPSLRVRLNYPYRGISDGHVRALRKLFTDRDYAGIELEVNQRWVRTGRWPGVRSTLARSLAELLGKHQQLSYNHA